VGKEVDESIDTSGVLAAKLPAGFDPKMLVDPPVPLANDPKPPLLAKLANPPEDGEADAVLPNTLPGVGLALEKPEWPNAGVAAAGDADAQGDAFTPIPITEDWPKAGAAGLLPKAGAPKAGVAAAGLLPKLLEPKAGAVGAVEAVDHGDDLPPRVEAPPKAGVALAGAPNGDGALAAGEPNAGAFGVLAIAGCAEAAGASPEASPG
jgi:hypothetical protein